MIMIMVGNDNDNDSDGRIMMTKWTERTGTVLVLRSHRVAYGFNMATP